MAFSANSSIKADSKIGLKDYRHAADLFNVDQFRLAPKSNFNFHVAFGINKAALKNADLIQRYGLEINLLVKSIDLPSFSVTTEIANQYNRKKVIQNTHKFSDITITFHDDNMGLINQLWQNYYSYYYADPTSSGQSGAYNRNAMRSSSYITTPYGLDNGSTNPFFTYIKIYQMARHEYVQYQLYNPLITNFAHNKLDYSDTKMHDFSMKIQYEAVSYTSGNVSAGTPEGFGVVHYDTTPSPLQGGTAPPTASSSFLKTGSTTQNAGVLNNAIATVNNYQNTQSSSSGLNLTNAIGGIAAGVAVIGIGSKLLGNLTSSNIFGLNNTTFPGAGTDQKSTTEATSSGIGNQDSASLAPNGSNADTAIPSGNTAESPAAPTPDENTGFGSAQDPVTSNTPNINEFDF